MKSWKNSRMAKRMCRLMGDRSGGVMMEYVILAVLIAAAAVVAVMFFGGTIRQQMVTMSHTISGESGKAADSAKAAKDNAEQSATDSKTHAQKIEDVGNN